jgi:hypothetical protein
MEHARKFTTHAVPFVLFIFLFPIAAIIGGPGSADAFKQADLAKLRATNRCPHCDLIGANLQGANLSNADLQEAILVQANLQGANLTRANLSWATLREGNLTRANLTAANRREAVLRGTNLTCANLVWANLLGADVKGANLTGAQLTLAHWTNGHLCAGESIGRCKELLEMGCPAPPHANYSATGAKKKERGQALTAENIMR